MTAIISDIHGNYPALKAVIEDISKRGITDIISLGDVAGYYCFINECIDLLRNMKVINILGNHDYYLISGNGCPRSHTANLCLEYQSQIIRQENLQWLKDSVVCIDNGLLSLRHGGWQDPLDEYIDNFTFDMVSDRKELIYASGHTHRQLCISRDNKYYVNPGSVGQPRDYKSSASYAIIDNSLSIELVRVEYPIKYVIDKMRECGFHDRISACLYTGSKIGEFQYNNL